MKAESFGSLKVWYGIEIDSCLRRVGVSLQELPWEDFNQLDYVLVEYVGEKEWEGLPLAEIVRMRKLCKIPMILAHPNIQSLEENFPLGILVEVMRRHNISLEITGGKRNPWVWGGRDVTPLGRINLS
ncbi:hypothetical protein HYY75_00195, partial [bacterium]|nr:hypothetical protein [bacterium]